MTDDLSTWLRAVLDAEEAALIRKRDGHEGPCINFAGQDPEYYDEYDTCSRHIAVAEATPYRDAAFGLAEVDAKRRILDRHPGATETDECPGCGAWLDGTWRTPPGALCPEQVDMALPLADRPGYRAEWRPA